LPSLPANSNGAPFPVGNLYATNANAGAVFVVRALYQDLEDWVVAGTTPPDSQVPKISDGTLVQPSAVAFPQIPGVTYTGLHTTYSCWTSGPTTRSRTSAASPRLPPATSAGTITIRSRGSMPTATTTGIRSVDVAAGLGTNTGWNYTNVPGRIDLAGSPAVPGLIGSYFPYAKTKADRLASGDPRPSLEERYGSQAGYVQAVTTVANDLVAKRLLLRTDADAAIAAAAATQVLP
jgi:hypothetical protein